MAETAAVTQATSEVKAEELLDLQVVRLSGDAVTCLQILAGQTVIALKFRLIPLLGLRFRDASMVQLLFGPSMLSDGQTLAEANLPSGAVLQLVQTPASGPSVVSRPLLAIRCRPLNRNEVIQRCQRVVNMNPESRVAICGDATDLKEFAADAVFDETSSQADVFTGIAQDLVDDVLDGISCSIFSFGERRSGKTYTMVGSELDKESASNGLWLRSMAHIAAHIEAGPLAKFVIKLSFCEIYMDTVTDLLTKGDVRIDLKLRESKDQGILVEGLSEVTVRSQEEARCVLLRAMEKRQLPATMDADSAISHVMLMASISAYEKDGEGKQQVRTSRLRMFDLAGAQSSERLYLTSERLREAKKINESLVGLCRVVQALARRGAAGTPPYREHKITRLMQDALEGKEKLAVVATCSPASSSWAETLSTLRFSKVILSAASNPHVVRWQTANQQQLQELECLAWSATPPCELPRR
eukprot:TRINITY_DN28204_c0_g1_i1.p1 TRINITY_DN28204_c0_g1~~TRINITY_DN28204_c0_g1_i1.p1  ORF type:complete len:471 (+),score=70.79 TRINITY_DN28204_c0_g1_i1:120-1532(+)